MLFNYNKKTHSASFDTKGLLPLAFFSYTKVGVSRWPLEEVACFNKWLNIGRFKTLDLTFIHFNMVKKTYNLDNLTIAAAEVTLTTTRQNEGP